MTYNFHYLHTSDLTSLVQTKSNNVGVDHAQVEGSKEGVGISQRNEHSVVDSWLALVDLASRLVSETSVLASDFKRGVSQVELADPSNVRGGTGRSVRNVRVVGADSLTGVLPGEVDELAGEGEGLSAVTCNGGTARVTWVLGAVDVDAGLVGRDGGVSWVSDAVTGYLVGLGVVGREAVGVRLVVDEQRREVLPCETSSVLGAGADVGSKVGPRPGLGDTSLEVDGHRGEAKHLAERHLLARLGGNGLREEVGDLAGVHVRKETPDTRLAEAGELHVEVDELADGAVRVVVGALRRSSLAEHVAQKGGVATLLLGHEGDVGAILSSQTGVEEVLCREDGETVVEQVELDPFLVETEGDGLIVEVAVHHVAGLAAIGAETTSWGVGDGHRVLGLAIGVVVGSRGVRGQRSDGSANGGRRLSSSSGGRSTIVWAMAGSASNI